MDESVREIIIDASVVLAYFFPDEKSAGVEELFARYYRDELRLVSCALMYFEVLNSVRIAIIRNRFTKADGEEIIRKFLSLDIIIKDVDFQDCYKTAIDETLTVYDASYLTLSKSSGLPLASLDLHLQKFSIALN